MFEQFLADGGYKALGFIVFTAAAIIATSGLATLSREIVSSWMRKKNGNVSKEECELSKARFKKEMDDIERSLLGMKNGVESYHRELKDNDLRAMREMLQTLVGRK